MLMKMTQAKKILTKAEEATLESLTGRITKLAKSIKARGRPDVARQVSSWGNDIYYRLADDFGEEEA